jgi:hypothetical protein
MQMPVLTTGFRVGYTVLYSLDNDFFFQIVNRAVFNDPSRVVPAWVKLVVGIARHYF